MRVHGGDILSYEAQFHKKPLDFSVNVSPLGLPEGVRQAVISALDDSGEYPDSTCRKLRQALADYHGIDSEWILCGNGAADLIDRLAFALANSGRQEDIPLNVPKTECKWQTNEKKRAEKKNTEKKKILLTAPTFTEYRFAFERFGMECVSYPLSYENGFAITQDFLSDITPDLTAVMLCEPNNPTGKTTDRTLLIRIFEKCRSCGIMLIIDECFQEFLDEPEEHTMQGYLAGRSLNEKNLLKDRAASLEQDKVSKRGTLLILKSFTKTYAMAGIRLGYCLCADQNLLKAMEQAAQPWAVSGLAQAAGAAALQETAYLKNVQKQNQSERNRLKAALADAGCKYVQGEANYILFWHEQTDLAERLAKKGILIRTCTDYEGLNPHWYRVAVLGREENNMLLKMLRSTRLEKGFCKANAEEQMTSGK